MPQNTRFQVPLPVNEPVYSYAPGSPERAELTATLAALSGAPIDMPMIIGGREVRTSRVLEIRCPHRLSQIVGYSYAADEAVAQAAVEAALTARAEWAAAAWEERAALFLRAADLLATKYRATLNAATMLGTSKTCHQAEIDAACELADFWRFNPYYMAEIYADQPYSPRGTLNWMDYRPLEGFVVAVTPFNFVSIAGNLPTAPALMGNTVVWKPARQAVLSAHFIMRILMEAGLPPGVINLVTGAGAAVVPPLVQHPELAGVHFTGSTAVFADMWNRIGGALLQYRTFPRLVGETGGKDFVVAHVSADLDALATALVRGAFEYSGQKCSAASRAYIPDTLWPDLADRLLSMCARIKMGDVADFSNFMGAVIDAEAFDKIKGYIDYARATAGFSILFGGGCDKREGFFIEPTVVLSEDPRSKLMVEEIFGPVLTIFVYPEREYEATLRLCDETSPYGLTGAVFARDRAAIARASELLRQAAGNFYINDKPTGAVVGQQPFGGSRASGTNDKAGSRINLLRWTSPRAIKENFLPPADFVYPYMG
ncbi:L-glutamate gamma-semialdehyde dehydrogenase [bacterium]|nr:L-glutamate gamma-semialdehyde dehydrogenase [bacterium]